MVWTAVGTPLKLDIDWQFTEPVEGIFFRFKHENHPVNAIYEIAQVELNDDGSYTLFDSQVLNAERNFVDSIKLSKPGIFSQRRLAIRRIPARSTFEQEIRRLLLPGYLRPNEDSLITVARNRWQVQIEASDYIEPSATIDLTPIQTKLTEISTKIDNLRSTEGNSTFPTGTTSDPYFSNVVFLSHFDGANNSVAFTDDAKGHTITPQGNAIISSAQSKFGGSSAYFNGSESYLSISNDAENFGLTATNYTVEMFLNFSAGTTSRSTILNKSGYYNLSYPTLGIYLNPEGKIITEISQSASSPSYVYNNNYTLTLQTSSAVSINSWHHLALVKSNDIVYLFLEGVLQEQKTLNFAINDKGLPLLIGGGDGRPGGDWFSGYIDELRITKFARYDKNFTSSMTSFPDS